MNIISGASYVVKAAELIAPALTTTIRGSAVLELAKDRPGGIRAHGYVTDKAVAVARFYARPGDHVDGHFEAVTEQTKQDPTVRDKIGDMREAFVKFIADNPGTTKTKAVSHAMTELKYTKDGALKLIESLLNQNRLRDEPFRNWIKLYVQDSDFSDFIPD